MNGWMTQEVSQSILHWSQTTITKPQSIVLSTNERHYQLLQWCYFKTFLVDFEEVELGGLLI